MFEKEFKKMLHLNELDSWIATVHISMYHASEAIVYILMIKVYIYQTYIFCFIVIYHHFDMCSKWLIMHFAILCI